MRDKPAVAISTVLKMTGLNIKDIDRRLGNRRGVCESTNNCAVT